MIDDALMPGDSPSDEELAAAIVALRLHLARLRPAESGSRWSRAERAEAVAGPVSPHMGTWTTAERPR